MAGGDEPRAADGRENGGGPAGVVSVRTDVLRDHLLQGLQAAARRVGARPLAPPAARALKAALGHVAMGDEPSGGEAERVAARVARSGWALRGAERIRLPRAREPVAWLWEEVTTRAAGAEDAWAGAVAVAADLARTEPRRRPDPDDPVAATWRVPGPGGHVRHLLALEAAREAALSAPEAGFRDPAALKRCFFFGFFLACCAEGPPLALAE